MFRITANTFRYRNMHSEQAYVCDGKCAVHAHILVPGAYAALSHLCLCRCLPHSTALHMFATAAAKSVAR